MSSVNVMIRHELGVLLTERQKVWAEFDRAAGLATELSELTKKIPECKPAPPQLRFAVNSTPGKELETIVSMIKEKLESNTRVKSEMNQCYAEIRNIKQKEKTLIFGLIAGGIVACLIFLIIVVAIVSQVGA